MERYDSVAHRIEIDVNRAPYKPANISRMTVALVGEILTQLGYEGQWKMTFMQRVRKKQNVRFQVISRKGNSILCRTKPGDNETAWEVLISPPPGYITEDVFLSFRQVPPSGIMKQKVATSPVPLFPDRPRPQPSRSEPEKTSLTDVQQQLIKGGFDVVSTKEILPAPVEKPPVVQEAKKEFEVSAVTTTAQQTIPQQSVPQTTQQNQSSEQNDLKLGHLALGFNVNSVGEHPVALKNGLVAVCLGISNDGHIPRTQAVELLIKELQLHEFVKEHGNYTDAVKVATIILKGLCDRGQLTRYAPGRKPSRVRDTTKGYILTPLGRKIIEDSRSTLPAEIARRLFNPDILPIPANTEESLDRAEVLLRKIKESQKNLAEYNALIDELYTAKLDIEKRIDPTRKRIAELQAEIKRLESEVSNSTILSIEKDIADARTMIDAERRNMENLKQEIVLLME